MVLKRERGERGAILILSALVLIGLLTISAIVVDISNARQVRRQARGSADAAALAGAQDLPDPNAVVDTVKDYVEENMDIEDSAWVGCTDPEHLAELPDLGNSNECISLDEPLTQVRVTLPLTAVDTTFGRVIGVDAIDVSASAVAEARLQRDDRIIPATVAASAGSGNLCIENGGNDADCAIRTSGNFGSIDSRRQKIYFPTSNVQADSLRINYSIGVDHAMAIWGSSGPRVCDGDPISPCTQSNNNNGPDANHLIPFTGNNVPPLTDGVIDNADIPTDSGTFTFCGRLRRPDLDDANLAMPNPENCEHWRNNPGPGPRIQVLGEYLNGRHITYWMLPEFKTMFYGNGITPNVTPSTDSSWAGGDDKLACFLRSYRFDYTGTRGHAAQTEFFIDPAQPINSVGDGVEFTPAQARSYLVNTCGLSASLIDPKLTSLTDSADFWPMFEYGMITDPRFGMIPVVANWSNGASDGMPIVRFWAIYMYRLYAGSTKLKAIDAWNFETALITTPNGQATLQFGYQTQQPSVRLIR